MNIYQKLEKKSLKHIDNIKGSLVLLRIDVNTSLGENNQVDPGEDWRIIKSLETIHYLQDQGARIVLLAHIGRAPHESLYPVFEYMKKYIQDMTFVKSFDVHTIDSALDTLENGQVLFMENVRQYPQEKNNDPSYLEPFIKRADYYINDAFAVAHRKHASVHALANALESFVGFQFLDEIEHLSYFRSHKEGIKILVLGGAKFGTKFSLLEKMLPHVDYVLMGGALANVFLKARGFEIGASFCDDVDVSAFVDSQKIILPIDYIDQHGDLADIYDLGVNDQILDIGSATSSLFSEIIASASLLMWNGPMGKYEDGYTEGSIHIAESIAKSESYALSGGGDTSTLILEHQLEDGFDFISTGGGAMLDFLLDGDLPVFEVLLKK